jgi:hypothetical protein
MYHATKPPLIVYLYWFYSPAAYAKDVLKIYVCLDTFHIPPNEFNLMEILYDTNFDALDQHFDKWRLLSDVQAEELGNPKCYDYKGPEKVKWNEVKFI